LIAAYSGSKLKAPLRFEGYTDTAIFNHWLKECLVPVLNPGQTVILDNASFHKSDETRKIIQQARCHLEFLPTYSPDLNPIEKQWAILKSRIRKRKNKKQKFLKTLDQTLLNMCI